MDKEKYTKEELIHQISRMQHDLNQLEKVKQDREWIEQSLKRRTYVLNERLKELRFLYDFSALIRDSSLSMKEKMDRIINRLPHAFEHAGALMVKLELENIMRKTPGYHLTNAYIKEIIRDGNEKIGSLTVSYRKENPDLPHYSFTEEERALLEVTAEWLGLAASLERERRFLFKKMSSGQNSETIDIAGEGAFFSNLKRGSFKLLFSKFINFYRGESKKHKAILFIWDKRNKP